jgi:hypothetical protein
MRCFVILRTASWGVLFTALLPATQECCSLSFSPHCGEKVAEGRMRGKARKT